MLAGQCGHGSGGGFGRQEREKGTNVDVPGSLHIFFIESLQWCIEENNSPGNKGSDLQ